MGGGYTASALYGAPPIVQATPSAVPSHIGGPEPTRAVPAAAGQLANPTALLILLLALAVLLVQLTVRGSFEVRA